MNVAVDVGVDVIAPVSVAALGNGNDIVDLIDAVDADLPLEAALIHVSTRAHVPACSRTTRVPACARVTASATTTVSFPFTSAITITAGDDDQVSDHVNANGFDQVLSI